MRHTIILKRIKDNVTKCYIRPIPLPTIQLQKRVRRTGRHCWYRQTGWSHVNLNLNTNLVFQDVLFQGGTTEGAVLVLQVMGIARTDAEPQQVQPT